MILQRAKGQTSDSKPWVYYMNTFKGVVVGVYGAHTGTLILFKVIVRWH